MQFAIGSILFLGAVYFADKYPRTVTTVMIIIVIISMIIH